MTEQTPPEGFTVSDRRKRRPDMTLAEHVEQAVEQARADNGGPLPPEIEEAIARNEAERAVLMPHAITLPPEIEAAISRHEAAHMSLPPEGEAAATAFVREATGRDDLTATYDRDPAVPLPFGDPTAPLTFIARCAECAQAGVDQGEAEYGAIPFGSYEDRDRWAQAHALDRRHSVTIGEQGPTIGTRIVGTINPPAMPLVAFMVPEGGQPDLMCRIPERAGAAWLLTAAHACMLGHGGGSLGIAKPHRVMYVGRTSAGGEAGRGVDVRIDGVFGATDSRFGAAIGMQFQVAGDRTPAQAEDIVEELITRACRLPRNLFSVLLIADAPVADPPDAEADAELRAARLAEPDAVATPAPAERVDPEIAAANAALLGVPLPVDPRDTGQDCPPDCAEGHTYQPGCLLHVTSGTDHDA